MAISEGFGSLREFLRSEGHQGFDDYLNAGGREELGEFMEKKKPRGSSAEFEERFLQALKRGGPAAAQMEKMLIGSAKDPATAEEMRRRIESLKARARGGEKR